MLTLSLLALAAGPLLYLLFLRLPQSFATLDGFVSIAMGGLILFGILPEIMAAGSWPTLLFGTIGFFGPSLLEHRSQTLGRSAHRAALALGIAALALHALIDGLALTGVHEGHSHAHSAEDLPIAVVLHRLPVALTVWWLVSRNFGASGAVLTLAGMGGATVVGATLGEGWIASLEASGVAWFQAFITGSLLHVVFHRMHRASEHGSARGADCPDAACPPGREPAAAGSGLTRISWAGAGGLAGLAFLISLALSDGGHFGGSESSRFIDTFLRLAIESAPALLLGYFLAGMMAEFLPSASIRWLRGGGSLRQALRGMALGLPIPVCSCGVVPLYRSLVLRAAPISAAIAFLVATPELGIDAFLLSLPLLGWKFTLVRVGAAAVAALAIGVIVAHFARDSSSSHDESPETAPEPAPRRIRFRRGLRVGFGEVLDRTGPWILVGLAIAAVVEPLLQTSFISALPAWIEVIAFTVIGIPMYICASGATPLAAVLLVGGISPGAVLAFLLTGPATNVTTFGMLANLHGRRPALAFSASAIGIAVGLGLIVNALGVSGVPPLATTHEHGPVSWIRWASLAALALLLLGSLARRGPRLFFAEIFRFPAAPAPALLSRSRCSDPHELETEKAGSCCEPTPVARSIEPEPSCAEHDCCSTAREADRSPARATEQESH